jgi:glycosyltransferase involved in cell wall biosynthesis
MPLGVDTELFAPAVKPGAAASQATLVSVGSLVPVKDHALLLRVFRRVIDQAPEARLLIAGEGPLQAELVAQSAGLPVHFLGAVDHGALPALYGQASALVQTSRHEAQGLAVLEAAACGVLAVGTPVGVLPQVGRAAQGEAALAEALVGLLRDKACREALGAAARARVLSDFELGVCVERTVSLYRELGR